MNNWLAVANAYSGGREGQRARMARIADALRPAVADTVFSEFRGHARKLAAAAKDYAGIVAVGGDGTLLEILNGIDRLRQEVAILPAGRGNSLARDLGLLDVSSAVDALTRGRSEDIDLAEITMIDMAGSQVRTVSASTIAFGYPAAATILANRMKYLGRFCYAAAATIDSFRIIKQAVEIGYDGETPRRTGLAGMIISNTRHLANFAAFPDADCADGRLDVMELNVNAVTQNVRNVSALCGVDFCSPAPTRQISSARAIFATPTTVMIDGEIFERIQTLDVDVLPGGIKCRRN
jgi:diacylglycerol kinase (ATP)